MIEELPRARPRLPVHPRARPPGALRPALARPPGRAPPPRGRGARGAGEPSRPRARRPRPSLRRRRAARRGRARGRVQRARRPGRDRGARLRRGGGAAAHRARAGDRRPRERAECLLELGTASHRAGKARDALGGVLGGGARSPASCGDPSSAGAGGDRLRGSLLAAGDRRPRARRAARGGGAALGEEESKLRVGLLSGLARALDFQGDTSGRAVVRASASTMARQLDDRPGWRPC